MENVNIEVKNDMVYIEFLEPKRNIFTLSTNLLQVILERYAYEKCDMKDCRTSS